MDEKAKVKHLKAREILDSRGNPTIEVEVTTESEITAIASCPSGASTGKHEAYELRDNDPRRYSGKGVMQAVENVNGKINGILKGRSCEDQQEIDRSMVEFDGTKNLSTLGANATTAVSLACAKAASMAKEISLYRHILELFGNVNNITFPFPIMNIINGGKHAGSGLSIQEFMIIPVKTTTKADHPRETIRIGSEIYHTLGNILSRSLTKSVVNVGDEGGYAPSLDYDELSLSYIMDAILQSGYEPGKDVVVGIDAAASNFWDKTKQKYVLDNRLMNAEDLLSYYGKLVDKYPLKYIEDPFSEDDLDSFIKITEQMGRKVTIVGDDIFVTDNEKVIEGIKSHAANGIIIKVNQIGTLTTAIEAARSSYSAQWSVIASHRSGETNDYWLADFAVGIGAKGIKAGAPARGERIAKYNRLMQIEQEEFLNSRAD